MNLKKCLLSITLICSFLLPGSSQVKALINWLNQADSLRTPLDQMAFAKQPLSKSQAREVSALLLADHQKTLLKEYGTQWDNRLLTYQEFQMPFFYQIFGTPPKDGRSLFISLHGGGGAPPEVNDQQYQNQQHLHDATMDTLEGIYLAPRAPTNTWNLWHQAHIDEFLNLLIQLAVIKENVNPNKVYLLGYSAGGDGVYQLAPRMADRLAAASMMAGHPNDASPLSLRNLPFALHMGALDDAYNRNKVAMQWGVMLDSLAKADSGGYIHQVQLHEGLTHWMKLQDAVALPWMQQYQRQPIPEKVIWRQSSRHHHQFYWLGTPEENIETGELIVTVFNKQQNEINILQNYSKQLQLFLNDNMLDLDKPVVVKYQGEKIFKGRLNRTIVALYQTIQEKGDGQLAFSAVVRVKSNAKVEQ